MSSARSSPRARTKLTSSQQLAKHHLRRHSALLAQVFFRRARRLQRSPVRHHQRLPPLQRRGPDRDHHLRGHTRLYAAARYRRECPRTNPYSSRRAYSPHREASSGHLGAGVRLSARGLLELPRRERQRLAHRNRLQPDRRRASAFGKQPRILLCRHASGRRVRAGAVSLSPAKRARVTGPPAKTIDDIEATAASISLTSSTAPTTRAKQLPVFPRDPRTGVQVWSATAAIRATPDVPRLPQEALARRPSLLEMSPAPGVDMNDKQPYYPHEADGAHQVPCVALRAPGQARRCESSFERRHSSVSSALRSRCGTLRALVVLRAAMADEAVARTLHDYPERPRSLSTAPATSTAFRAPVLLVMHEGSWGAQRHQPRLDELRAHRGPTRISIPPNTVHP